MRGKQLFLFPELDPFKTLIKDVDFVDLSTLTLGDENRKNILSSIPKGRFFIYKTGAFNRFLPELGNVFPYIKNEETGRILSTHISNTYVKCVIKLQEGPKTSSYNLKVHRIGGEAFVVNDDPKNKVVVDHKNNNRLDYRILNLRWLTWGENNRGVKRTWGKGYEDRLYLDPLASSENKSLKM